MKRITIFACFALVVVFALSAAAAEDSRSLQLHRAGGGVYTNAPTSLSKAGRDSIYLIGAPGSHDGRFETPDGNCNWQGWTSIDETAPAIQRWHADIYNADNLGGPDNHAAWCGDDYPSCGEGDPDGGYGNAWDEMINFWAEAPDPAAATQVVVNYDANFDTEPAFDFVYLQYETADGGFEQVFIIDGDLQAMLDQSIAFTVEPVDYLENEALEMEHAIHIQWNFVADGAFSDADCLYASNGACQIDNLQVTFNDSEVSFDDFEDGPYPPEVVGNWTVSYALGVGNYAQLWSDLQDVDPCRSNPGCQVAFVDYPGVVPCSVGQQCITWCYGPGGYIVNTQGGCVGPEFHIENSLISPPLEWADQSLDGATYIFTVYRHETLVPLVSPGMFYIWGVRSINTPDLDANQAQLQLELREWENRTFVEYGGPDYFRQREVVTDLLEGGRTWVQLQLGVFELGWQWNFVGDDGTPAPYFDNVAFATYPWDGPGIAARDIDIAQDTFPEIGTIDYANPGANSCRFDMARNISPPADLRNDPGDSIFFDITAVRAGSSLNGRPRMHFKIKWNQTFEAVHRVNNIWGYNGDFIEGSVEGFPAQNGENPPVADRWAFDLPDTGFLFPGDVLHYYIRGEDIFNGDIGVSTFPSDTSGFSDFTTLSGYNIRNTEQANCSVNFLPTLRSLTPGDQPPILLWNDFADRGGQNKWYYGALNNGFEMYDHYDVFYTNGPSSGVGNGLGGRATATQLQYYTTLLYTAGDLSAFTLSNGDFATDPGQDVAILNSWLSGGDKNAFFTGDDLAYDLSTSGPEGSAFLANWIGVQHQTKSIQNFIGNQTTPTVRALPGNPVWALVDEWVAYGGCNVINEFDGVTPIGNTVSCAEFLNANGQGGIYPYSAGTYHYVEASNNQIIYMPYDFIYIFTPSGAEYGPDVVSARAMVLREVMLTFSHVPNPAIAVPEAAVFTASNYPNPFNPGTNIEFSLPQRGRVTLKIYNVRGGLVRAMLDEVREADTYKIYWDGKDDHGGQASSGVYFYKVDSNGESRIEKMALVK